MILSIETILATLNLAGVAWLIYSTGKKENRMATSVDNLVAAVAAEETVIASVEALLTNLTATITAANNGQNPAIDAIVAKVTADTSALSTAVTTNTPASS